MDDLISRQAAIKAIEDLPNCYNGFSDTYDKSCIIGVLEELPSAQPETCAYWDSESNFCALYRPSAQPERRYDEWCTDCKEYDHERHCCPRFNHVIRTTLQDVRKKGKWILINGAAMVYECDQCHERVCCVGKYCMNCGLPMEVEE